MLCDKCANDRCKRDHKPNEIIVACGGFLRPMTNGDRFRAWSDEEWADRLLRAARSCDEAAVVLHGLWCDDQGACVADGQCDDDRVRACVLRWLKAPAREEKWTDL